MLNKLRTGHETYQHCIYQPISIKQLVCKTYQYVLSTIHLEQLMHADIKNTYDHQTNDISFSSTLFSDSVHS
jgi:hypothetical protein